MKVFPQYIGKINNRGQSAGTLTNLYPLETVFLLLAVKLALAVLEVLSSKFENETRKYFLCMVISAGAVQGTA